MFEELKTQLGGSVESVRRLFQRPAADADADADAVETRPNSRDSRQLAREEHHRHVRLMRRELYQLMEQHPTSREVMRHLDLVERVLRREGFSAVRALPVRVIAKALQQLETLVWDWTPAGLAELRSRLAVIVRAHQAVASGRMDSPSTQPAAVRVPDPDLGGAPVGVATEIDHAAYEEMERSWAGQLPSGVREAGASRAA